MTSDQTLQAALALLSRPSTTITSEQLIVARDDLDLPAALADIERLEQSRNSKLLTADDAEIEQIDADIRAARRAWDRRSAASLALEPLIAAAERREAKADLERWGEEMRVMKLSLLADYVAIDAAAIRVVELRDNIRAKEAAINDANARFRQEGRADLMAGLPMQELALLANVTGENLPFLDTWHLQGYSKDTTVPQDASRQPYHPSRRFGRLAELLPDGGEPAPAPAPKLVA